MTSDTNLPPPLNDHLCLAIYNAGMTIQRLYKPLLDELGITYPQYLVMNLLWTKAPRTVGDLAIELDLDSSTLTPLLKRLEANDIVVRRRNPVNEREVHVSPTQIGLALQEQAGCISRALVEKAGMSNAELSNLNGSLRDLNARIKG